MSKKSGEPKKKMDSYLKYSGLAFQLAGVIFGSIFLGKWIDGKLGNETPYATLILIIALFGAYLYKLTKELS